MTKSMLNTKLLLMQPKATFSLLNQFQELFNFFNIENPEGVAISNESHALTWRHFAAKIDSYREALSRVESKRIVGIALDNGPELSAWLLATIISGHAAVLLPPKLTAHERNNFFKSAYPDLLILSDIKTEFRYAVASPTQIPHLSIGSGTTPLSKKNANKIDEIFENRSLKLRGSKKYVNALEPDTALIQFTSGTTGAPTAIALSHANIANCLENHRYSSTLDTQKYGSTFCPVPTHHAMGCALLLECLVSRKSFHTSNNILFGEHFNRIREQNCSSIDASPDYFRNLLRSKTFSSKNLPSIEKLVLGSDRIGSDLIEHLQERFPSATIICRYGLTEAFGALAQNILSSKSRRYKSGDIGDFLPGVTHKLIKSEKSPNKSVLAINSPTIAIGCWNSGSTELPVKNGFLRTGDLAEIDSENRIIITGRESQFIKYNGFRINPHEIEDAIRQFDKSILAVAVGIKDDSSGQKVAVCINAGGDLALSELRAHCIQVLSSYKVPALFYTDIEIPFTKSGKVARSLLREKVEAIQTRARSISKNPS